jgi:hypothetical protein
MPAPTLSQDSQVVAAGDARGAIWRPNHLAAQRVDNHATGINRPVRTS